MKKSSNKNITLGIDATNLLQGGGRTHLVEILRTVDIYKYDFAKVIIWGSKETLDLIDDRKWLEKKNPILLEKGLLVRSFWQRFRLGKEALAEGCDILWVPGGTYVSNFQPVVVMSRNMLPFEWNEMLRYGLSFSFIKLILLRVTQIRSFKNSNGVIFLTQYAYSRVNEVMNGFDGFYKIIPHGISRRFQSLPKNQESIDIYTKNNPYRIVYVSIINVYKHQWVVIEALANLRLIHGWSIVIDLVGPSYPPAYSLLMKYVNRYDPNREWVNICGEISYNDLTLMYQRADLGIFASSCENMPNILLETMIAGLPIATAYRGPMPEILGDRGIYFDPESPKDIAKSVSYLIMNPLLRQILAQKSYAKSLQYSWKKCANETFSFLAQSLFMYRTQRKQCVA